MRTQAEILARLDVLRSEILHFGPDVLVEYLTYENARPFVNDDVNEAKWQSAVGTQDHARALADLTAYMDFAWRKVEDHRGLSANRSVQKLTEWSWLLGRDDVVAAVEAAPYPQYGAPKLLVVCKAFDLSIPVAYWAARMMNGDPCSDNCEMGCGR